MLTAICVILDGLVVGWSDPDHRRDQGWCDYRGDACGVTLANRLDFLLLFGQCQKVKKEKRAVSWGDLHNIQTTTKAANQCLYLLP